MPDRRQIRLGVDIGSSAIKLVAIKTPPRGSPTLLDCVIEPLPPAAVEAKQIRRVSEVNTALKEAFRKISVHTGRAYLAIPTASATTRQITLPDGLNPMAIEARVRLAAEAQISSANEPLCVDYQAAEDQQTRLTATRQSNVNERVKVLQGTALSAGGIDLEAYAVIRAVKLGLLADAQATIGIVDLGQDILNLTLLSNGKLIQARDQVFHNDVNDCQQTADAVKRLLALLTSTGANTAPAQLIICGGRALASELLPCIEQVTVLPVTRPDFRALLSGCSKPLSDTFHANSMRLITAIGLALPVCWHDH